METLRHVQENGARKSESKAQRQRPTPWSKYRSTLPQESKAALLLHAAWMKRWQLSRLTVRRGQWGNGVRLTKTEEDSEQKQIAVGGSMKLKLHKGMKYCSQWAQNQGLETQSTQTFKEMKDHNKSQWCSNEDNEIYKYINWANNRGRRSCTRR